MRTSPENKSVAERLDSLQVLRALAAIAVVFAHISAFATGGKDAVNYFPDCFFGNAGVDLFFIISGFTMVYTTNGKWGRPGASLDFAWRRIARVVPIYWIVTTWVIWQQHAPNLTTALANMNSSVRHMLSSYFFIPFPSSNGTQAPIMLVGWTLNFEMFFYFVFTIALLFPRRLLSLAGVTVAFLALAITCSYYPVRPRSPLALWSNPLILEFVFGMWLAVIYGWGLRIWPIVSCGMLFLAGYLFYNERSHGNQAFVRIYDWGYASLLIVSSVLLLKSPFKKDSAWARTLLRPMVLIGDASYVLYLTHLYILLWLRNSLPFDPATSPWLFAFAILGITISIAIVLHFALERPVSAAVKALPGFIARTWSKVVLISRKGFRRQVATAPLNAGEKPPTDDISRSAAA